MRPALHHRQNLPSLMILKFLFVQGLVDLILNHKIRQIRQKTWISHKITSSQLVEEEQEWWINPMSDRARDHYLPDPKLIHIPMSHGDDDQQPETGRQRQRSRSRERSYPHAQVPQGPQVQPMIIQEPVTDRDEDLTVVNPSSSTRLSPPVEQRDRSRRQQRSRSRQRTPQRTPPTRTMKNLNKVCTAQRILHEVRALEGHPD